MEEAELERLLGGRPRLTFEEIVGHPLLPEARKVYFNRFLELYSGNPFLVRLLIESGRFYVYLMAVVLDAAQDPARRETWATVGLLKQHLGARGLASSRQVDHLIARLCAVGFMELRPAEQDGRVRLLKPTEKLHAHDRDWLVAHYAPLAALYPQHDYALVMGRDPKFQATQRRVSMRFVPLGRRLTLSMPDMMLFFQHAAGVPVILALAQAAMAADDYPHAAVPYTDVGDRFGVSRTHVRKLLVAAEEAGLVKLHRRGGQQVQILPRLWSSQDHGMAGGMYLHDILYVATINELAAPGAT